MSGCVAGGPAPQPVRWALVGRPAAGDTNRTAAAVATVENGRLVLRNSSLQTTRAYPLPVSIDLHVEVRDAGATNGSFDIELIPADNANPNGSLALRMRLGPPGGDVASTTNAVSAVIPTFSITVDRPESEPLPGPLLDSSAHMSGAEQQPGWPAAAAGLSWPLYPNVPQHLTWNIYADAMEVGVNGKFKEFKLTPIRGKFYVRVGSTDTNAWVIRDLVIR